MSIIYKKIEISLTSDAFEAWERYCKFREMSGEQIVKEILSEWVAEELLRIKALDNELNGEYPSERLEHM